MAQVAWGAAGTVELLGTVGPHNFAIRISPLTFAVHAAAVRYEVEGLNWPADQQPYWDQHTAWLSIDLPGKRAAELRHEGRLASAYKTLMFLVAKHWSPNCLAIYFPADQTMLPNRGELIESIRLARRDGINLDFLKEGNKRNA